MHVDISGEGTPVLFLHGGGVSGWMWQPVLDHLSGEIRSIVPDLPGHGKNRGSDYVSHDVTIAELVELIRDAAPSGVLVVGFSLGAQLAIRLASEQPSLVAGAIIVSGEAQPAPVPAATLRLLKWAAPLARYEWFARLQARQLAVPEELLNDYIRGSREMSPDTLLASAGENIRFTLPAAWGAVAGPATVLVGERERGLMRHSAAIIHESLDDSVLCVVPGAAHDIPFSHPELLADVIRQSVARNETR